MVEKALRENAKEDAEAQENTEDAIVDDVDLSLDDLEKMLKDEDFMDFDDFLNEAELADAALLEDDF
jgi:hypothetical protein